jgi:hypothetical protein
MMEAEPPSSQPASGIFTHNFWFTTRSEIGIPISCALNGWNDSCDKPSSHLFRLPFERFVLLSMIIDHRVSAYCMHPYRLQPPGVALWEACSDGRLLASALLQTANSRHTTDGQRADLASWVSRYVVTGA